MAVAHRDSMFIWRIGLACLVTRTEAQPAGCATISGTSTPSCGVLTSSTSSIGKMEFKSSSMADMVVKYSGSSVEFGMMAFKMTPGNGNDFTVHMECSGGSCTKGAGCSYASSSCSNCVSCPSWCTARTVEGAKKWDSNANSLSFVTYCGGEFGSDPSPSPDPPPPPPSPSPPPPSPSPPAAVCGTGTIFDAISGKCKINCDENDPPGRRLSERPLTPADAAASDTAKESREQSTRARKAIDSHLASQPDLDDAQRSALSYHLERLAAESLWFPEEE